MKDAVTSAVTMLAIAWRASRSRIALALVLHLLSGATWPLLALALRSAVDVALAHDLARATVSGALIGVGALGALLLQHFAFVPYAEATEMARIELEVELIQLANGSPGLEHHERPEYADKALLVQREISQFSLGMIGLMTSVTLSVSIVVTGLLLALVSPWLLLLPLAAVPPLVTARWAQQIIDRSKDTSAATARQAEHLFHLATGAGPAKELRVFRLTDELRRRHTLLWDDAGRTLWAAEQRAAVVGGAGQLVFALAYVAAVLLVVRQAIAGAGRVGDVVLVITLAGQVNQQVNSGLEQFRRLQRMAAGLTRLRRLRALIAAGRPPAADLALPERIDTAITLRDVTFAYPGSSRPGLGPFDLTLPSGSTVALIGENGAGKSTLIKLLCRFYQPTGGTITVDGADLQRFDVQAWQQRIAAGFQDFARFELAARQSVGVGDLPHLDEESAVLAALHRARADDVVQQLPDGLSTLLGKTYQDGAELSGGQWQKVALGRAMMREMPLLLVLDEPTSALDAQAEHLLFEQYARNARRVGRATGAITVLVSHRFSTVQIADLIVVVDGGRIVETGDHATLMAQGGLYAELYTLQAAAYR